ncbi:TetR/AcrR family transcriptional regulator C-terminal domain-containing protein [Microbispora sp. NPDC049125]|uniref:TetR/AcrR family transcriptional regulator C-terminal domain-containing protein n=1 Tax=Microbispora sp. NPDC049125 TaxID=3154929 RepID=UPI003466797F
MRKARVSRETVLAAALALVDREGIAALSMRKLGAELGVEAMTLYYHVPNKDAVLDGLVNEVVSRIRVELEGPWREWTRAFAVSIRRELLAHPALLPLVATRPVLTPGGLDDVERIAAGLRGDGFSPSGALHMINVVATFVIGHTLAEAGSTPGHDEPDVAAAMEGLDPGTYPVLAEALRAGLGTPENHQERFDLALDSLLDGLAARLRSPE